MTEEVVKEKLYLFAKYIAQESVNEFKPSRATDLPGFGDEQAKEMASDLFEQIEKAQERTLKKQFRSALKSIDETNVEPQLQRFLETDPYYLAYEGEHKDMFRQDMKNRMLILADNLAPIVDAEGEDFWDKVISAYSEEDAYTALEEVFKHHNVVSKYRDNMEMRVQAPVIEREVEYTDESLRSYRKAEKMVWSEVKSVLKKRYR